MPHFFFFAKGEQVIALDRSVSDCGDEQKRLAASGFKKQFEEIEAISTESAFARFTDIRDNERNTEHAFATGSIVSLLTDVITTIVP